MLELLRGVYTCVWCTAFVVLLGSQIRGVLGRSRHDDRHWNLLWFASVLHLGYAARWVVGLAPPPVNDAGELFTCGLLVLGISFGLAVLWTRYAYGGSRW